MKASSVLKSSDELFNQFRKAAIEKEVKARTQEQIRKHLEHSAKDPKVSQESQRSVTSLASVRPGSKAMHWQSVCHCGSVV